MDVNGDTCQSVGGCGRDTWQALGRVAHERVPLPDQRALLVLAAFQKRAAQHHEEWRRHLIQ